MINENNKIPDKCIILALDQFFNAHRDMDTWNDIKALTYNDWDFPNNEDSLAEIYEAIPAYIIASEVFDFAKHVMNFTLNHGGTFDTEENK